MAMVSRVVGGLMLGYVGLYLAQYLFSACYDNPGRVWSVMNVISGVGILVAFGANLARLRSLSGGETPGLTRLGAITLVYANAALAIWYFHNWIRLLILAPGEVVSAHHEVIWQIIAVLIPLVLATTGWRLWRGPDNP